MCSIPTACEPEREARRSACRLEAIHLAREDGLGWGEQPALRWVKVSGDGRLDHGGIAHAQTCHILHFKPCETCFFVCNDRADDKMYYPGQNWVNSRCHFCKCETLSMTCCMGMRDAAGKCNKLP
ncbi:hypothetical protein Q7C36_012284 [Tachysurus vachellii]|uniref:Uncharacterized protein n=1 Tax=Tachysurus vachellii TaxID=175792 RepID=A0AA88SK72_TACVA|nr:hypothetical protein Q7C36_012284 [Tachysurus vachellii]